MSPAEAADVVYQTVLPHWPSRGTLKMSDVYEDSTSFAVQYGNAEYLDGDDPTFLVLDTPVAFVSKADGAVTFGPYLADPDRLDAMTITA